MHKRITAWITILVFVIFLTSWNLFPAENTANSSPRSIRSAETPMVALPPSQCSLSLLESDGWFCELIFDWKQRKKNHRLQDKRNRMTDTPLMFFQNNWEPTFQCAFERRLGNVGDGGKWVCDIHRLTNKNNGTALIYSFGSNEDFSFERAVKEELPNAEIHTFDRQRSTCPENVCVFHQAFLGNGRVAGTKSLLMIIDELGHRQREIDVLKVDIEGSEFSLFEDFFQTVKNNRNTAPYVRQILFEIHFPNEKGDEPCLQIHRLFELFRRNHYVIFHKESNLYAPTTIFEYALLRLNRAFFLPW